MEVDVKYKFLAGICLSEGVKTVTTIEYLKP